MLDTLSSDNQLTLDKRYLVKVQIKANTSRINDQVLQKGAGDRVHHLEDQRTSIDRALPTSFFGCVLNIQRMDLVYNHSMACK
jgi:hypothetical protein